MAIYFLENILVAVEYFFAVFVMFDIPMRKSNIILRKIAIISIIALEEIILLLSGYVVYVAIVGAFASCFLLFDVKGKELLKLFLILYPCIIMLEAPFYHLVGILFEGEIQDLMTQVSMIAFFLTIFLIRKRQRGWISFYEPAWRFLIVIVWITALMLSFFQYSMRYVDNDTIKRSGNFLFVTGSIAVNFLILLMLRYLMRVRKVRIEMKVVEKYNEQQRMYFLELLNHEQKTKKFRHDINNQIMQLKDYCEKQEYEKLETFLLEMSEQCAAIKEKKFDVGNEIVNVVLNYYLSSMKEDVLVRIKGYMHEENIFSQRDLCVLFSNIVKNAVEAISRQTKGKKEIILWLQQKDKELLIHIENTFDSHEVVTSKNGTIKTDQRNHGFGNRIIDEIVEKYHGKSKRMIKDEKFVVELCFI